MYIYILLYFIICFNNKKKNINVILYQIKQSGQIPPSTNTSINEERAEWANLAPKNGSLWKKFSIGGLT